MMPSWIKHVRKNSTVDDIKQLEDPVTHLPRRIFLKSTLATAVLATVGGTGLLATRRALAAEWAKDAFTAPSSAPIR